MTRHNNKILLLSIISAGFAQGLTIISVPWYFTEINQSSIFALSYGCVTFMGLFWGLYSGVMIDFFNRKKILLYINLFSGLFFGGVGLATIFFNIDTPFVFLLGFAVCSFYYIIFFPNLYAITQELTKKKEYVSINSFIEILLQITSIFSAITCGLLLSKNNILSDYFNYSLFELIKCDIGDIFILNSTIYFITFFLLLNLKYRPQNPTTSSKAFLEIIKEISFAISFLRKHNSILVYGVCSQIIFAFLIVELFTLLPVFVKNCLNKGILVFSSADVVYGLGAIIASIITFYLLKYINKITYTILLIIVTGYAILCMITWQNIYVFFLSTLIIGLSNASVRITRMTYLFEQIPSFLMGRINTVFNTINTLIRIILIVIFSTDWFSEGYYVIIGYQISIYVLILFAIPLLILEIKTAQLNRN